MPVCAAIRSPAYAIGGRAFQLEELIKSNVASAKLGPYFSQIQLQACEAFCGHDTRINYGFNLTASDASRLAKALQKWSVSGFEESLISRGAAIDTTYVYLGD